MRGSSSAGSKLKLERGGEVLVTDMGSEPRSCRIKIPLLFCLQPHSLIANVIAGSSALGYQTIRDAQTSRHLSAVSEVASALRSFSPLQSTQTIHGSSHADGAQLRGHGAMTGSG